MNKAVSLIFRGLSMVGKFALLVYMAKVMALQDVGVYGLITASVVWLTVFTGLDFHNFCLRELISGRKPFAFVVSNQQGVFLINYGVLFLLCLIAGWYVGWQLVLLIFLLTVLEHQVYEASMLAIALRRPLFSALLLFLRSGSWPLVAIAVMALVEQARNLYFIVSLWVLASSIGLFLAYCFLYRGRSISFFAYLDKRWIIVGLKTGLTYWVASLILRMTGVLDRYIMEAKFGLDMVGVYSFYLAIGLSLIAFVDSAILSFMYPDSVRAVGSGNYRELARNQNKMLLGTLLLGVVLSLAIIWAVPKVLNYMGALSYIEYEPFLTLSLLACMAYTLSMIPHFGLYSLRQDGKVFIANASTFAVFVLALIVFRYADGGHYAVVWSVLTAHVYLFILKMVLYHTELARVWRKADLAH